MKYLPLALALLLALPSAADAAAGGNDKGKGKGQGQSQGPGNANKGNGNSGSGGSLSFNAAASLAIRNYFRTNPLPPQGLPPGIAKNLARGKPLPPGIAKRYLPENLRSQLPRYEGYDYVVVDKNVLLVSVATGIVVDILENVF